MRVSPLHQQWFRQKRRAKLLHSHNIVDQFITQNQTALTGSEGIIEEHTAVDNALNAGDWSQINNKREMRYSETAYLIWALGTKLGRNDLLTANVTNWDNGSDDGNGSNFRNLEFEAHVALRFAEEGFDVQAVTGDGKAEMVVEDAFAVECKRRGVFNGSLKARKQITAVGKPGFVIFNLDDLHDLEINPSDYSRTQATLDQLSIFAEHGFGNTDSELLGAALEYVPEDPIIAKEGSVLQLTNNCSGKRFLDHLDIFQQLSVGLTGDLSMTSDILPSRIPGTDRFQGVFDNANKQPMKDHYDKWLSPQAP